MTTCPRNVSTPADIELARTLFVEYAAWLAVDLCFQGFAEELASLPGVYAPPRGRLLLAGGPSEAFGCIALRPLHGVDASKGAAGEIKRLYVQPAHRREGWGRRLAEALIDAAGEAGYRELFLDTFERMSDARQLYARLGFRECAPYYHNPLPGAVYMRREL